MAFRLHRFTLLLLTVALALVPGGCRKEQTVSEKDTGISLRISVALETGTKASFDLDGDGAYANQCRLQILSGDDIYYDRTVEVKDGKATFHEIQLDRSLLYDYLFWADNSEGGYYETSDLRSITLNGAFNGCDEKRDAFYGAALGKDVDVMNDTTLILHRPFAQLNIITCDIPALYDQLPDKGAISSLLPDSVTVTVSDIPTVFDVSTGTAGGSESIGANSAVYTKEWRHEEGAQNTLSMNYFFATSEEGARIARVDFSYRNTGTGMAPVEFHWTNVPFRRNWRTNILGDLITTKGDIEVNVSPLWNGTEDTME